MIQTQSCDSWFHSLLALELLIGDTNNTDSDKIDLFKYSGAIFTQLWQKQKEEICF